MAQVHDPHSPGSGVLLNVLYAIYKAVPSLSISFGKGDGGGGDGGGN